MKSIVVLVLVIAAASFNDASAQQISSFPNFPNQQNLVRPAIGKALEERKKGCKESNSGSRRDKPNRQKIPKPEVPEVNGPETRPAPPIRPIAITISAEDTPVTQVLPIRKIPIEVPAENVQVSQVSPARPIPIEILAEDAQGRQVLPIRPISNEIFNEEEDTRVEEAEVADPADVETDPNRAPDCDPTQCVLPDCFCSADGTRIPGNLQPDNVPQMITISFNGAINIDNIDLYEEIFAGTRVNPNGCQIRGTFFVSHKYTNYSAVQDLHRRGHEIAVFSVTHKDDPNYWSHGSYDDWLAEMAGARLIVKRFANITDGSIIGLRAPYLRVGGNKQFEMMSDQLFVYDASITASLGRVPIWPYTLNFRMPHKCNGNAHNCPTRSYPIWEMVINELDRRGDPTFDESLPSCHMVDSCSNIQTGEQLGHLLRNNFNRHFYTNRAPLGLNFHASWLKSKKEFREELIKFIEEMSLRQNVYFVTNRQVIQWIQNPKEVNGMRDFQEWKEKCDLKGQPYCSLPNSCTLNTTELPGETLRLFTCMECPNNYPWILDPTGDGFSVRK